MKKRFIFILCLLLFVLIFTNLYTTVILINETNIKQAKVRFTVVDIENNNSIYKACVCIPEANVYYYTDNNGNTPLIEIPVIYNSYYDNLCCRDFGEISVIVYKEGYVDFIMLNLVVKENQTRDNIKLLMYKKDAYSPNYTSIVETPDNDWIQNLIDKYKN